jgi:plasmid stabilization system protein ParE
VKPVLLHDDAVAELHEAAAWYEQRRPGLGAEFRSAVERAVSRIRGNPQAGARFRASRFRYLLVRRFPYIVFFAEGRQAIRVLAVAHARRRPGYWTGRARE